MSSALTFASVLTLTFQFLIFAYVYSSHRVRFFYYLLLAWGLMSVSKGLHLARTFLPEWDVLSALLKTLASAARGKRNKSNAPAAKDKLAPSRCARLSTAQQHLLSGKGIVFGGRVEGIFVQLRR